MKRNIMLGAALWLTGSLLAADSSPKEDITNAAKRLADKPNYSWRTTVVVPESAQFKPGPTVGKTEKDGFTHITMTFGDNTTQAVIMGDKAAVTRPDGGWRSLAELDGEEGPARHRTRRGHARPDKGRRPLFRRPDGNGREGAVQIRDRQQSQRLGEVLAERWRAFEVRVQGARQSGFQRQRNGR